MTNGEAELKPEARDHPFYNALRTAGKHLDNRPIYLHFNEIEMLRVFWPLVEMHNSSCTGVLMLIGLSTYQW